MQNRYFQASPEMRFLPSLAPPLAPLAVAALARLSAPCTDPGRTQTEGAKRQGAGGCHFEHRRLQFAWELNLDVIILETNKRSLCRTLVPHLF